MRSLLQALARFAAPVLLLAAAFVLVYFGNALPPSLAGLKVYGPYIVLGAGAALATAFNRGRALIVLVTLVLAYGAQQLWLQQGLSAPGARGVYAALAVFVPINAALAAVLPERGVLNRHGVLRLAVVAVEAGIAACFIAAGGARAVGWVWQKFFPVPFGVGSLPQAGIATIIACLIVAVAAAFVSRSAVSAGCAGAIIAFTVAAHVPTASYTFSIFTMAAGMMMVVAVLHDAVRNR